MKEMVGGCCVCSDERGWPENPLVYCDGQNCTVAVHQACYGIVTVPTGPWFCRKCESQERSTRVRCELCPSRDGALKKTDNNGWAHVVCALYIPEVRFGNVTTMEPIILSLIPQERYGKNCYICQELLKSHRATVGACMQCNKSNCKQQFHVTCAQSLGLLCEEAGNYLDNVKYCGYCQHHYSKLKKGGNVKTIPPYKPISHDTSSDSGSSPEKEIDPSVNATASSTSATSIKITTNLVSSLSSSSSSVAPKQRKSSNATKQSSASGSGTSGSIGNLSASSVHHNLNNSSSGGFGSSSSTSLSIGGAGTTSSSGTNMKSSTSGSTSGGGGSGYKDKDSKHSKNINKVSSSSKDKESFSSSRDLREKSSKSSKNKDATSSSNSNSGGINSNLNTSMPSSSTPSSANSTNNAFSSEQSGVQNLSTTNSNNNMSFGQSSNTHSNLSSSSNSAHQNSKDLIKNPFASSANTNAGGNLSSSSSSNQSAINFLSDHHSDATNLTPMPMDITPPNSGTNSNIPTNLSSNSFNKHSNNSMPSLSAAATNINSSSSMQHHSNSQSSSSFTAKKRKNDSRSSITSLNENINSTFRDIIKDVMVTLTPLTDFEKEIEKSSKRQKTELSPPTHQSVISAESSLQNSRDAGAATISVPTTSSGNNNNSQASSSAHHKSSGNDAKANAATGAGNASSTTTGHKNVNSSSATAKEREERYAAAQAALAAANGGGGNNATNSSANSPAPSTASSSTAAGGNGPSLYVSVPLSNANVPGINIHTASSAGTTTSTGIQEHPTALSTRSTSQLQQQQQQSNAAASSSTTSSSIGRQSPFNVSATSSTTNASSSSVHSSSNSAHGVIFASGKSPSGQPPTLTSSSSSAGAASSSLATGINLSANNAEIGSLKINYEKQNTRVSQIQEQESAPVRRSRTPDSGVFSSSSFNISGASTASPPSSSSLSGLKFSYEAQLGGNTSSFLPPTIDNNTLSAIAVTASKESPPSSPTSEQGTTATARKRGRRAKDTSNSFITTAAATTAQTTSTNANANILNDLKDGRIYQNGLPPPLPEPVGGGGGGSMPHPQPSTSAAAAAMQAAAAASSSSSLAVVSAAHMLGNQLNPNSSMAQKLTDQLSMEMQDHSVYSAEAITPQFVGVPFPGKLRNSSSSTTIATPGPSPLASIIGSGANDSLTTPQNLEQLLERQWEQGSQFLMEQAQHFDIASLLSCLHQLQSENIRLDEHVSKLIARRDHLLAVNARLAIPLSATTNTQQTHGK